MSENVTESWDAMNICKTKIIMPISITEDCDLTFTHTHKCVFVCSYDTNHIVSESF